MNGRGDDDVAEENAYAVKCLGFEVHLTWTVTLGV